MSLLRSIGILLGAILVGRLILGPFFAETKLAQQRASYRSNGLPADWQQIKFDAAMAKDRDHAFLMEASSAAIAAERCHFQLQDWVQIKVTQLYPFGRDRPPIDSPRENWLRYASLYLGQNELITASQRPDRCEAAQSFYGRGGYNMISD